jgi:hypothetical protein
MGSTPEVLPKPPVSCSWSRLYSRNQTAIFAALTIVNSPHHHATGFDQASEFARPRRSKLIGPLRM